MDAIGPHVRPCGCERVLKFRSAPSAPSARRRYFEIIPCDQHKSEKNFKIDCAKLDEAQWIIALFGSGFSLKEKK